MRRTSLVLKVSVIVSRGRVSPAAKAITGNVTIGPSLSKTGVLVKMFSVRGSVLEEEYDDGSISSFSNVVVRVMYRVFLTVPTCKDL